MPTLVVVGNQDILTPRGDSEELAELIPTAELVVISGAAHGLMVEHASTYNRILADFLRRAEAAYQERVSPIEPGGNRRNGELIATYSRGRGGGRPLRAQRLGCPAGDRARRRGRHRRDLRVRRLARP